MNRRSFILSSETRFSSSDKKKLTTDLSEAVTILISVVSPPRDLPIACLPLFLNANRFEMHLHGSTVQTNNSDIYLDDSSRLRRNRDTFHHTDVAPSVHTHIDYMPISIKSRWCSSLIVVSHNIHYWTDHLEFGDADISSSDRKIFSLFGYC